MKTGMVAVFTSFPALVWNQSTAVETELKKVKEDVILFFKHSKCLNLDCSKFWIINIWIFAGRIIAIATHTEVNGWSLQKLAWVDSSSEATVSSMKTPSVNVKEQRAPTVGMLLLVWIHYCTLQTNGRCSRVLNVSAFCLLYKLTCKRTKQFIASQTRKIKQMGVFSSQNQQ